MADALITLFSSIAFWLLSARLSFRVATRRGWMADTTLEGRSLTGCQDFYRSWHDSSGGKPCRKCATRAYEDFEASRRNRLLVSAFFGPFVLAGIAIGAVITARQPVSPSEQAHRLKKAEEELQEATAELERLRGG